MKSKTIVSKYRTEFTAPPKMTPQDSSVDGPLLGNGDMGIAIGGEPDDLKFFICKNDLWRLQHQYGESSPLPLGYLAIAIPALEKASYRVEQDLYSAIATGRFNKGNGAGVTIQAYVVADRNLLVLEMHAEGESIQGRATLEVSEGRDSENETGKTDGVYWGRRAFTQNVDIPSGAAAAWKWVAAEAMPEDGAFVLNPGKPLALVLAMDSIFKHDDYVAHAVETVNDLCEEADLSDVRKDHESWWSEYWEKSYVSIPDPVIEKQYYVSLYGLGSCSRDPEFPPPIFGWTTSDHPLWEGDYHLNYNHQAPFYGLARANRLEQADPHDAPFLDFMGRAAWHCREIYGHEGGI